jgi:hypothetical protein
MLSSDFQYPKYFGPGAQNYGGIFGQHTLEKLFEDPDERENRI